MDIKMELLKDSVIQGWNNPERIPMTPALETITVQVNTVTGPIVATMGKSQAQGLYAALMQQIEPERFQDVWKKL